MVVMQGAAADPVYTHCQLAGGVRTDHTGVRLHPVGGVVASLFGRQQGNNGLEGIEAEGTAVRQRQLAACQVKTVAHCHITGTMPGNLLYDNSQIVEFKQSLFSGQESDTPGSATCPSPRPDGW